MHAQVIRSDGGSCPQLLCPWGSSRGGSVGLKPSPLQPNILKGVTRLQNRRLIPQGPWFQATEADTSQERNLSMGIGYLWILECSENHIQKVVWNKGKLGQPHGSQNWATDPDLFCHCHPVDGAGCPATLDTGCSTSSLAIPAPGETSVLLLLLPGHPLSCLLCSTTQQQEV